MGIIKAIARFFLSCLYSPDQSEAVFEQATSAYEQFLHPTDPNGVQLESHLNSAIALYREAVRLRRPNHPELGATLINLAAAIWSSYELSNKSQDKLNEVIELDKEALLLWKGRDPKPKDYPLLLTNLGMALLTGSNTESQASNKIDEAIDYLSAAYSLCDQCSYKSVTAKCVFHLASAHHTRFVQGSHSDEDLDATIKFFKATLELVPAGHKYREGRQETRS
ncbi:hypothetical protein BDZ97DRAFT_622666 [Flammula alnicola]|nr:hypothetical protein BDZ97DRAFT_622666 [Flammula alnicola]